MSLVPIAIGRCGHAINTMLSQYSVDYINHINNQSNVNPDFSSLEANTFVDSIKRSYFKDDDLLDSSTLISRGITIGTDLERFNHYNDDKSCESLFANYNQEDNTTNLKSNKSKLTWKADPNSLIDLPDPTYQIDSFNYYKFRSEKEIIEEKLMKQLEEIDSVNGILTLAGLGGGTGSGISSLVSNIISDNLNKTKHLVAGVLPFSSGEFSTQSINTTLALSQLYDNCDGLILIPNDDHESFFKLSLEKWNYDLNTFSKVYAMNLFHSLRPVASSCSISNRPRYTKSFDYLIDGLCSFPSLKLLDMKLVTMNGNVISGENKIHEQMIKQIVHILGNDDRSPSSTREKITFSSKELDKDKKTTGHNEVIPLQDFERFKNKVHISESDSLNKINKVPIISPTGRDTRINDLGILVKGNKLTEEITGMINNVGIRLIKTVEAKRKKITTNNVVIASQINIGGIVNENLDFSDIYKNVMFWKNSFRPLQVTYSKYDKGINGKLISNINNSLSHIEKIDNSLVSASLLYNKNAYMNKYKEYGLEKNDIKESIIKVQNIIENYKKI